MKTAWMEPGLQSSGDMTVPYPSPEVGMTTKVDLVNRMGNSGLEMTIYIFLLPKITTFYVWTCGTLKTTTTSRSMISSK